VIAKPAKCKVCKAPFQRTRPLQTVCGYECSVAIAQKHAAKAEKIAQAKAKAERRDDGMRRLAIKTRAEWLKEAKVAIQRFRRLDELAMGSGCMSCGRTQEQVQATDGWKPGGAWDGGHFISKGARPELALEPLNIWLQCKSCNAGSGKYARKGYTVNASFRANLIERIGLEQVEWLEGPHEAMHYTIDDLKAIKQKYTAMTRELRGRS